MDCLGLQLCREVTGYAVLYPKQVKFDNGKTRETGKCQANSGGRVTNSMCVRTL